ncbi:MAG: hypothetical protein Q8P34_15590, partial [Bacteroidota bacterium]|nr:hypothetical protein [Bacteroidota bacterium]
MNNLNGDKSVNASKSPPSGDLGGFKIKLAQRIAWIAGGFALVLAILLIVNYVQTSFNDPIENQTIPALVKRLSDNPGDEALKAEIRA